MKRKNASLLGNVLMGLGLVVMVVGVGYSILNQLPQLNLPQFFAHGAILSIFVGAVLWLAGARIGGHEQATGGCATTINAAVVTSIVIANRSMISRIGRLRPMRFSVSHFISSSFSRHITPPFRPGLRAAMVASKNK